MHRPGRRLRRRRRPPSQLGRSPAQWAASRRRGRRRPPPPPNARRRCPRPKASSMEVLRRRRPACGEAQGGPRRRRPPCPLRRALARTHGGAGRGAGPNFGASPRSTSQAESGETLRIASTWSSTMSSMVKRKTTRLQSINAQCPCHDAGAQENATFSQAASRLSAKRQRGVQSRDTKAS